MMGQHLTHSSPAQASVGYWLRHPQTWSPGDGLNVFISSMLFSYLLLIVLGCLFFLLFSMSYFKESNVLKKVKSESEVAQLCPTLCDPMDYSLSGSSIRGIFQARVLEWVAISFSRGSA